MRDYIKESTKSIIIDSKLSVARAKDFLINYESDIDIEFHDNSFNQHIFEKYEIKKTIQKALQPRVDLPSGGYIIIDSKFSVARAKDFLINYESDIDIEFHDNSLNQHIL